MGLLLADETKISAHIHGRPKQRGFQCNFSVILGAQISSYHGREKQFWAPIYGTDNARTQRNPTNMNLSPAATDDPITRSCDGGLGLLSGAGFSPCPTPTSAHAPPPCLQHAPVRPYRSPGYDRHPCPRLHRSRLPRACRPSDRTTPACRLSPATYQPVNRHRPYLAPVPRDSTEHLSPDSPR